MTNAQSVTPILRIFDVEKAKEFYIDFLGFKLAFEHRFHDNAPLYAGVLFSDCELHLSEHHGDISPGAHVRIQIDDVSGYTAALAAKKYKYANPGEGEETPWGTVEVTIADPFGNRLTFYQETTKTG